MLGGAWHKNQARASELQILAIGTKQRHAAGLKQMASAGVPALESVDDKTFAKALPAGESERLIGSGDLLEGDDE